MAYRLPSPKFRVQNLLNRTKTYGSARKIIWNKVGRADKYNIYRSYIPYGKFTLLATVSGDTTEYIDESVGIISNNDFEDLEDLTVNTWRGWYYRLSAVRANGEEGYISDPYSDQEATLLNNPPFGSYQVGDGKEFKYCGSSPLPDEDDTSVFLEIRNRDLNILQRDGQWVWYFKQRAEGQRCPYWVDTLHQCKNGKNCPVCHGTGLAQGGYYDPVKILVRLVGSNRTLKQYQHGLQIEYQARSWTVWTPILANRDIIVTNDGRRYEILDVTPSIIRGGVITKQDFNIKEKMPEDFVYTLEVPGPLY